MIVSLLSKYVLGDEEVFAVAVGNFFVNTVFLRARSQFFEWHESFLLLDVALHVEALAHRVEFVGVGVADRVFKFNFLCLH